VSEVRQTPSEEKRATQRLAVMDAILLATERRGEVLDAIAEARDRADARRSVAELLGFSEDTAAAEAVVELRLHRFSQSAIAEVQAERDALKRRLDQGL
jgi:DNA gyrase/topoisomerase IV subunit A